MQNGCANLCQTNLKSPEILWVTGMVETFPLVSLNKAFCQGSQALYLLWDFTLPPVCVEGCTCTDLQPTVLHC